MNLNTAAQLLHRKKWGFLLCMIITLQGYTQDVCQPVGWAAYGGTITGGGTATPVTVTTIDQLKTQASSTDAKVIYVQGTMGAGYSNASGERVEVKSDKTIIGLPGATVKAFFSMKSGVSNIILRNLIIQGPGAQDIDGWDNVTIDNSTRIWIDHCDIRDGEDGNLDIKNAANYVTITWTKFSYTSVTQNLGALNHSFSNLIGSSDDATQDAGKLKVTLQYNWWEGAVERMPRVRFGQVHVVNNLFTEITSPFPQSKSGVTAGFDADVRVEKNAFYGIDDPIDVSKLAGNAKIQSIGNLFSGTSGNSTGSGTAFTPPYTLATIAAADVRSTVLPCVGATLPAPSPTIVCPCGSALPVTLIYFNIKPYLESYLLTWSLADTETLKNSVVEYSIDGINFQQLEILDKNANRYVIPASALQNNSIQYIRLKFIEEDGYISYSPIKSINKKGSFHIYPNPFINELSVRGVEEGTIMIYTMEGNKVYQNIVSKPGTIDLSHLSSGTYFLIIVDNFSNEIRRFPLIKL